MKNLLLVIAAFVTISANAQGGGSPHETVSSDNVSVTYGRPYKKGRDIFGGLVPYNEVWRLGADKATQITFSKDVKFAGKPVKAGTYTLFAIPTEKEWEFILNSQLDQWGAFSYEKNKDKDVLHVKVPASKIEDVVDQFTIRFPSKTLMVLEWDKTQVSLPISF
jgi:hypothetical protein